MNRMCASNCNRLAASDFRLIMFQEINGFIEPAWTGLSNSNVQPNINLTFDSTINPCSNAMKLNSNWWLKLVLNFLILTSSKVLSLSSA